MKIALYTSPPFVAVDHRVENHSSYLNFDYVTVDKWMEASSPKSIQKTWNKNFKGPKVEQIKKFKEEFGGISWKY